MIKEKRKLCSLYVGDFIYFDNKVGMVIETGLTKSFVQVVSQNGNIYTISDEDTEIDKIHRFDFDLGDSSIISEEKVLMMREYIDKREEYETKLKFLNYFRKEVRELGSELGNYFEKLKV